MYFNTFYGTLLSVGYSEKDIQDIRKNNQYQVTCGIFTSPNTRFFYKQHFYKQRQAEIGKKISKSEATP